MSLQSKRLREGAGPLWKPEACWVRGKWSLGKVLLLGQGAGCRPCHRLPSWGSVPVLPPLPFAAASVLAEWPRSAPAHGVWQHPAAPPPASPAEPRPGDAGHPATGCGWCCMLAVASQHLRFRAARSTRWVARPWLALPEAAGLGGELWGPVRPWGPTWVSLYFCCPCWVLLSPPNPATSLSARVGALPREGPSTLFLPLTGWQTCVSALAPCPHTLPVPAEGKSASALSLCHS